jgi:hypothetical protein
VRKPKHKVEEYIILGIPENPYLFGIEREATPEEKRVAKDPHNEVGDYYESVLHLVSPYINYYTKEKTESCTCLSWRTRQKRCVHLKAFYKRNPHLDKNISDEKSKQDAQKKV